MGVCESVPATCAMQSVRRRKTVHAGGVMAYLHPTHLNGSARNVAFVDDVEVNEMLLRDELDEFAEVLDVRGSQCDELTEAVRVPAELSAAAWHPDLLP